MVSENSDNFSATLLDDLSDRSLLVRDGNTVKEFETVADTFCTQNLEKGDDGKNRVNRVFVAESTTDLIHTADCNERITVQEGELVFRYADQTPEAATKYTVGDSFNIEKGREFVMTNPSTSSIVCVFDCEFLDEKREED